MYNFKFLNDNLGEFIFVTIVLIVFLCSSLIYTSLPGFGYDEAINPILASEFLVKNDYSLFNITKNFSFSDLMVDPIVSSVLVWLYVFVFYFFDVSVFIIRFTSVFFGLVFLLLFYFFIRDFFNRRIAMFSLILVSTFPILIFLIKTNINHFFLLVPIFGCLLFFWRFYKKRKITNLIIGSLFFGFGFSYSLMFLWFILALFIAFVISRGSFHFRKKELIIGILVFLLGASPIILWNISTLFGYGTIRHVNLSTFDYVVEKSQNCIPPFRNGLSLFGVDIFQFDEETQFKIYKFLSIDIKNSKLATRLSHMSTVMQTGNSYRYPFFPSFNWWFFLVAFIFSLCIVFLNVRKEERKKILFILMIIILIFLESAILSWSMMRYHIIILVPFCMILSANLLNCLYKHSKILTYVLLGLIILSNLLIFSKISITLLSKMDVIPDFPSSNIYQLTEYLKENEIYHPISIIDKGNTGIYLNLQLLSYGKITPFELNLNNYDELCFTDVLKKEFLIKNKTFIVSYPKLSSDVMNTVDSIIKDLNKVRVINKTFCLGNGRIEYLLFQVEDA